MVQHVKRLYRSRNEKILGGVCGGLGEYFEVDPVLIRLIWVVLTLLTMFMGIIVYLIAWIIIPEGF
jgi:phage shock protein PspC (stress-responsive transcriptional regulator)